MKGCRDLRLVVLGGGVAGSYLALLASRTGMSVDVFEARGRYAKPCGEVVAAGIADKIPGDLVKTVIRRYLFYVDGMQAEEVVLDKPGWLVVDKPGLIHRLLSGAEEQGARITRKAVLEPPRLDRREGVVVDARGPYSDIPRRTIMLARAVVRNTGLDPETVELWFDTRRTGFYWVFPHNSEGDANVGAGFIGEHHPHILLHRFIEAHGLLSHGEIVDMRAAPLTIDGGSLYKDGVVAVGEAAGLVNPLTGEGIRPAMLSAEALAEALARTGHGYYRELLVQLYRDRIAKLMGSIRLQRLLLSRFQALDRERRAALLRGMPTWLWKKIYVEGRLGLGDLFHIVFERPRLLAKLL